MIGDKAKDATRSLTGACRVMYNTKKILGCVLDEHGIIDWFWEGMIWHVSKGSFWWLCLETTGGQGRSSKTS